jgi:hypothetical protein
MLQKSVYTLGLVLLLFFLPACSSQTPFAEEVTGRTVELDVMHAIHCEDSDKGVDAYTKGSIAVKHKKHGAIRTKHFSDRCHRASVIEMYCNKGIPAKQSVFCIGGCMHDACVPLAHEVRP